MECFTGSCIKWTYSRFIVSNDMCTSYVQSVYSCKKKNDIDKQGDTWVLLSLSFEDAMADSVQRQVGLIAWCLIWAC